MSGEDQTGVDLQECGTESTDYGSGSEETSALLSRPSVTPLVVAPQAVVVLGGTSSSSSSSVNSNPPAAPQQLPPQNAKNQNKPVLQRQDRATYLVASPQLSVSGLGGSEESNPGIDDPAAGARSVPDIELQCRLDELQPSSLQYQAQVSSSQHHYRPRQMSHVYNRCRCERRDSLAPSSALHLARSVSRLVVRIPPRSKGDVFLPVVTLLSLYAETVGKVDFLLNLYAQNLFFHSLSVGESINLSISCCATCNLSNYRRS